MLNRSASLALSTSVLKALSGKLDIIRHSPNILYVFEKLFLQALKVYKFCVQKLVCSTLAHRPKNNLLWAPIFIPGAKKILEMNYTRMINSFHASGNFCHLLIFFANSFDRDKDK